MTKETYDTLSDKEKLMYDELNAFAGRLTARMQEVIELLNTILTEANSDPK